MFNKKDNKNESEFTLSELSDKSNEICNKDNLTREDIWDFVKKLNDLELKFLLGNCYLKLNEINKFQDIQIENIRKIIKFEWFSKEE